MVFPMVNCWNQDLNPSNLTKREPFCLTPVSVALSQGHFATQKTFGNIWKYFLVITKRDGVMLLIFC